MKPGLLRFIILTLADLMLFYAVLLLSACVYRYFGALYELRLYACMWKFTLLFLACEIATRLQHAEWARPSAFLAPVAELRQQCMTVFLTYLMLFAFLSLSRQSEIYSRIALCGSFLLNILFMPLARHFTRRLLGRLPCTMVPVLIAGSSPAGMELSKLIDGDPTLGLKFVGFIGEEPDAQAWGLAASQKVDCVLVCTDSPRRKSLVQVLSEHFQHVILFDSAFPSSLLNARFCILNGCIGLEMSNGLLQPVPRILKGLLETVLALAALCCLWPLFAILALLVKMTSRGSVFYAANRLGLDGKPIRVMKFRTMYQDAETRLASMLLSSPDKQREWKASFKLESDPRITSFGRFLRKTSLDELPQLWNVIIGDMAIIGPRPIVPEEIHKYGQDYALLKKVKPGMTGLWQVSGRSKLSYERRVALDVHYIMNWSIWMDYYILLKTIPEVFLRKGAY